MKFIKFPNGKVWRVSDDDWISGAVLVPGYDNLESLEDCLDAIAEAATGSCAGLMDFSYQSLGCDIVSFSGVAGELPVHLEDYAEAGYQVIAKDDSALVPLLMAQYNLTDQNVAHALASLDLDYGPESELLLLGSFRRICSPAHPAECDYVRIVVDGFEIAYWTADEWQEDPACVMGAILGAAHG